MFHVEQSQLSENKTCPSCGHQNYVTYLELTDYFLTKEDFSILKCSNCGLLITYPQPIENEIGKYYKSTEYISHNTGNRGVGYYIYDLIRRKTLASKLHLLKKYSKGNLLLDIGCATGVFLNHCRKHGFQVEGIEPDNKARQYALEHYHLPVKDVNSLNEYNKKSFDVITMWHVLEHVADLNERMSVVRDIMKDTGTLFVALPNPASYDAKYFGKYWAAYDVPRHLFHFTKDSFTALSEKYGFKIIKVLPMIYDSYYISLLSEKYKNGNSSYLKALLLGMKSNSYARKHDTNYSSLIYILKKV